MKAMYLIMISIGFAILLAVPAGISALDTTEAGESVILESFGLNVDIMNHYAVSEAVIVYSNPSSEVKEIRSSFEKPSGSLLSNMSLTIDGEIFYAEIVEKAEANQKYDEAKEANKTATKISATADPDVFAISLNIEPGEQITLRIRFEQIIAKVLGEFSYRVPLDLLIGYESFLEVSANIDLNSSQQITLLETSGSSMELTELWEDSTSVKLSYTTSAPSLGDIIDIMWKEAPLPINGTMGTYIDGTGGYFMHVFSPQLSDLGSYIPKDIIFVLDKSGSMSGVKIDQLKDAFDEILHQVHPEDRFNVVYFDSSVYTHREEIQEADEENIDNAANFIRSIDANGGTNINEALLKGLDMFTGNEEAVPIIVFLTDGNPTSGVTSPSQIRQNILTANQERVAIYSLGFGYDLDFNFINALSLENDGYAVSIPESEDAGNMMTGFYDTISIPLLKDLEFRYTGYSYDVIPECMPSLFDGSEAVIVGRFDPSMEYIVSTVRADTASGEAVYEESHEVSDTSDMPFISRLWAHRMIEELMNDIAVEGETQDLKDRVISIALNHSFVTRYTSFILVVEREEEPDEQPINEPSDEDSDGDGIGDNTDPMDIVPGGGGSSDTTDSDDDDIEADTKDDGSGIPIFPSYPRGEGANDSMPVFIFLVLPILIIILIVIIFGFSRIRKDFLLNQENRKKIYEHIIDNPGDYFRSIQRAVDLEVGVLSHHINVLEKEQMIVSEQDGNNRKFYAAGVRKGDEKIRLSRIQENILKSIRKDPGMTQVQIARRVGVSRKVVFYHVKFLRDAGMVNEERVSRKPHYYPA
ncbi:MAG: VIT domain-containing protein [Thermoplasmatota archaeon]